MTIQEIPLQEKPGAPFDPATGPQTLQFDDFPPLTALLRSSGLPGVTYLHCHAANIAKAQAEDFWPIRGVPAYTVKGHPVMLLGRGVPIRGARPESAAAPVEVDTYLDELMEAKDAPAEGNEVPSPKAEVRSEAASGVQKGDKPGDRGQEPQQREDPKGPKPKGPPLE